MTNPTPLVAGVPVLELLERLKAVDVRVWLDGEHLRCSAPAGAVSAELRDELRTRRDEIRAALGGAPIAAPAADAASPLAPAQERLWFFHQLEPESAAYNMSVVVTLQGPLDVPVLERGIAAIIERHQVLRTTFPAMGGEPRQDVQAGGVVRLTVEDLSDRPAETRGAEAEAIWKREADRPFDLATELPCRLRLLRLGAAEHHLLITLHHIAADGGSLIVFMRELVAHYSAGLAGTPATVPALSRQYAAVARQQRQWLVSPQCETTLEFWMRQFPGELPVLDLPADYARPAVQTFRGGTIHATIPPETAALVRALSRRHGCTPFMTLLAVFKTLLYRCTGTADIVVGSPMAGRDRAETRDLIGLFINTLALRSDLSGNPPFEALLGRVRATCLDAFAHQELPFAKLLEAVRPERDLSRTPLFQVMFNMFGLEADEVARVGDLTIQAPPVDRMLAAYDAQSKFDLTLYARDAPTGIELALVYNADLFSDGRMRAFLRCFRAITEVVVRTPSARIGEIALDGGEPGDQARPVVHALRPAPFEPMPPAVVQASIPARFNDVAMRSADRIAVQTPREQWTYRALAIAAGRIAAAVDAAAGGAATRVALLCDQGAPMIAAMFGVLQQGSAYVPLDPSFPAPRLALVLEDAAATVVLADRRHEAVARTLAAGRAAVVFTDAPAVDATRTAASSPVSSPATAASAAYILYTSGSTGQPKGVVQTHAGVLHHARTYANSIELTSADRVLLIASYTFDAAVMDIFGALLSGATLHVADVQADGLDTLATRLAADAISIYHSTPTVYRALTPMLRPEQCATIRAVVLGGEEVRPRDLSRFRALMPAGAVLVNGLGPTESTTALQYVFDGREEPAGLTVPVGYPVDATEIRLLDRDGAVTPVMGEIAIVSPYVATGYWNRPDLTTRAFLPVPGRPTARLYRTGDLGRRRPDGAIEFLGRQDQQVKIRGVRIELGEIEACLERYPGVVLCAAACDTAGAEPRLAAFVVTADGSGVTSTALLEHLANTLPGYMVPAVVVLCPSLPLTSTGKIDRRALPAVPADAGAPDEWVGPRDATEGIVAEIWADVLGRTRIGVHDSFFALGGHSLHATQVMARLRSVLGVNVPLRALFTAPTVASLSNAVRAQHAPAGRSEPPLVARGHAAGTAPLSYSQDRMWFLQQLIPDGTAYNMIAAAMLTGPLDRDVFAASLETIAARHEILRTTFAAPAGVPIQRIASALPISLIERDLRHLPIEHRLAEAQRLTTELGMRSFDLEGGPLWWTLLVRLADDRHAVVFGFHHIIGDLWSFAVFGNELTAIYHARVRGESAVLPPMPVQYGDYAAWQRHWLEAGHLTEELGYWIPRLKGLLPLELPTDRPRPPVQTANGERREVELPASLVEQVRALSVREGVTPFMTFLTAFNVLLHRYTGQHDLAVGVPIANRTRVAVEQMIGTFVNTLVHRNDLSGNPSFRDALGRVRGVALDAFDHQDVPFERLVREIAPDRDASRSPLFQVLFNMANVPLRPADVAGMTVEPFEFDRHAAQFDLTLIVRTGERSVVVASFNTDLFDGTTIDRLLQHYITLLAAATRDPECAIGRLPIMPAAERRALLVDRNATTASYPDAPVTSLIAAQAARTPDAVALESGSASITYADLDARANRLARWLGRRVAAGTMVGVCLDRSPQTVVALLGVMKAGCAYIPIDPAYPPHRVKFMIEDSRAGAVITESRFAGRLPASGALVIDLDADRARIAAEPGDAPDIAPAPMESLAYVLYTSGSTGNPKGVQIPHRALVNFLWSMRETPGLVAGDVLLAVTTISFDIAGLELYLPLVCGGTVVLASREIASDGRRLHELLVRRQPTVMQATPATWRSLIDAGWKVGETPRLRVFCGGEAFPPDLATELLGRAAEVWNLYGPTETTIWSTVHRVSAGTTAVPIGRPIANTQVYVLDQHREPTPVGVPGELYIGGDGVARGYLHRPDLTAERFVDDPFAGPGAGRMYRTGDRACFRQDGTLEHLGRLDQQVKVRGYRIELGEIEMALAALPAVSQAVVDVRHERLVAYVVFARGEELTASEIRASLRDTLPDYMIPSLVVPLEQLPLTPNGKVERRALPDPLREAGRATSEYVAPATPTEVAIAAIWKEILGVERVSTTDNFFELGGHSLLSIRVVHEIQQKTGWRPDPRLLFFETLARIAAARVETAP